MPILDTNVLIDLMRTRSQNRYQPALEALTRSTTIQDPVATTRFCIAELLVGVERSDDPTTQRRKVGSVLAGVTIREFNDDAMNIYPRVEAHLLKIGRPVGTMDMLIASVAIASRQVLLTRNIKHFQDIPELELAGY